eukprot:7785470-Prorocentrum_lima.AAC.1
MTSSLVGSEMCIRDRCKTKAKRSSCIAPTIIATVSCRYVNFEQPWHLSVSYTHLTLPTICSV